MKRIVVICSTIVLTVLAFFLLISCDTLQVNKEKIEAPSVYPKGGVYSQAQRVTLSSTTSDVDIYYTTDGGDPTTQSDKYEGPFTIDERTKLKVRAFKKGWDSSPIVTAEYFFELGKVSILPLGGNFSTPQTVTLSCETADASIYYSVDGTVPGIHSTLYTEPFIVDKPTSVKAVAIKDNWTDSNLVNETYTFRLGALTAIPEGGVYFTPQMVTLSYDTGNMPIYYTIDGSEPNDQSMIYKTPILIDKESILRAKVIKDGWGPARQITESYRFELKGLQVFPKGGNYQTPQQVKIYTDDENALIYYTLNDSEAMVYSEPIFIDKPTTLRAKIVKEGWESGLSITEDYLFTPVTPIIDLPSGKYYEELEVTISSETPGAIIYYTTDGSDPTENSFTYSGPVTIDRSTLLKAKAYKTDWSDSETASAEYTLVVKNPIFSPPGGTYYSKQAITITCDTPKATIRYNRNNSEHTESSYKYSTPLNFGNDVFLIAEAITAKAFRDGWTASDAVVEEYKFNVATPTFNPPGGEYAAPQFITISCDIKDALIRYSINGSDFVAYSYPVTIIKNTTLKAKAIIQTSVGEEESDIAEAEYIFINPGGGSNTFIHVEGGTYRMGNDHKNGISYPEHTVNISSFAINKFQVTQREWVDIMVYNPSEIKGDDLPVTNITWYDVIEYCNIRSYREGYTPCYSIWGDHFPSAWDYGELDCDFEADGYRLPTEAEWEYAARGGKFSKGYEFSGSNNLSDVGWYYSNSNSKLKPVGEKQPNELHIYDMSGNVGEWCWDWSGRYSDTEQTDPVGPTKYDSSKSKVIRGGTYRSTYVSCRVDARDFFGPKGSSELTGFRLCRKNVEFGSYK